MSQATLARMSAKVQSLIPPDELTGSMTRERIALLVRYTGAKYLADGLSPAKHWLAHMLDTEIPYGAFDHLCGAFTQAEQLEDCDLEFWYDVPNTAVNREAMQRAGEQTVDFTIEHLTNLLSAQIGITS